MKKIDENAINGTVGMPIKSGVFSFLQSIAPDGLEQFMRAILFSVNPNGGNYADLPCYIGAKGYGADGNPEYYLSCFHGGIFDLSDDMYFFWQGNIYTMHALYIGGFTNTAVLVLNTVYNNISVDADPVLFTDGISRNVLQTLEFTVVDGNSGTPGYICDWVQIRDSRGYHQNPAISSSGYSITVRTQLSSTVTIGAKGVFDIIAQFSYYPLGTTGTGVFEIEQNGSVIKTSYCIEVSGAKNSITSIKEVQLNYGDTIKFWYTPSSGNNTLIYNDGGAFINKIRV
jgi:hypothetical protein